MQYRQLQRYIFLLAKEAVLDRPQVQGTMSHIWYFCPGVQTFWNKIFEIYRVITGSNLQPDIFITVLSMIPGSIKSIKKGILKHFVTAARKIIARNWKSNLEPSIGEWECELGDMRSLEERMILETGLQKKTGFSFLAGLGRVQSHSTT